MKRYCLNEDVKLKKLPVRFSDELAEKMDDVVFYNRFEVENLNEWINDIVGITSWLSNPAIAWDNRNVFIHYNNESTYISRYGILFQILNYIDKQGVEHNFVYVLDVDIKPQNYNLRVPPYLCENKKTISITESRIKRVVRETLRQYLQL